jgi:DNA-binding response OmpR family regulator
MNSQEQERPLILVIDDVSPVVRLIELELGTQGFRTRSVLIDEDPMQAARDLRPSAVVLGSSLPAPPVYDVLMTIKEDLNIPVLFLHAGGNDTDAALALDMGADDTLGLPFGPEDLTLRLRAMLDQDFGEAQAVIRGELKLDVLRRVAWLGERHVALGTSEWALVLALAQTEEVVPAGDLLAMVWGEEYRNEIAFLELWTERLRMNLGDDPVNPRILLGDEHTGYSLAT